MNDILLILWLFPVLFVIHDFEEIVLLSPWAKRNLPSLRKSAPKYASRMEGNLSVSTSAFALAVLEEFIILSVVTVTAHLSGWYYIWLGVFVAFTLHLAVHIVQSIAIKKYIPALLTSILFLPLCIYILTVFYKQTELDLLWVLFYAVLSTVLMVLNLMAIHKGMRVFDRWLARYVQKGEQSGE